MARRAAKKDLNHSIIARALVDIGAAVVDVAGLPGALDLLVGFRGRLYLLEIKQPKAKNDLTELERKTIERLQSVNAPVAVVTTIDEAYRVIGAI